MFIGYVLKGDNDDFELEEEEEPIEERVEREVPFEP